MFNRFLIISTILCGIILHGCTESDGSFAENEITKVKTRNWIDLSGRDTLPGARCKLYKVTCLESQIIYNDLMRLYYSEPEFEYQVYGSCLDFITNYYTSHMLPYDSTWNIGYDTINIPSRTLKKRFKDIDLIERNIQKRDSLLNDPATTQMKRGDFWNTIFAINREIANPDGFAIIEKAIREAHEHWDLDWNDTIFVRKNEFDVHRWVVNDIFTNMRDEVNPVYLK
ncbi:MAG: hypothetical protein IJ319_05645 [Bacteroidaceae bacterium]|nr:hypothetical protein [Bacteroidaceae bacterium]